MQRGACRGAALSVVLSIGCIDLARPPELTPTKLVDASGGLPTGRPSSDGPPIDPPPVGDAAVDAPAVDASPADAGAVDALPDDGLPGLDAPAVDAAPVDLGAPPVDAIDAAAPSPPDAPPRMPDAALPVDLAPPPPDAAPPDTVAPLLIDNFQDGDIARNSLAAETISANQDLDLDNGELSFAWRGSGPRSQDFAEFLRAGGCPLDLRPYRTLSFRMRASAPDKLVYLVMGRSSATCLPMPGQEVDIAMVPLTTTMTTYNIDLTAFPRDIASFFQWVASADSTRYFLDDIQLLP